jgi:hypothetical protein
LKGGRVEVVDVEGYWRDTFTIPGLDHKGLVFYGPPLPKSGQAMFAVTAWTSIGLDEYCEVVPAKRLSDSVESLVEQAKAGLVDQVARRISPGG